MDHSTAGCPPPGFLPPQEGMPMSSEDLCEWRWEGRKVVEEQNVSWVCQVVLAFLRAGWLNHQSLWMDPLETELITLWKIFYCVPGRDMVCPHSGSQVSCWQWHGLKRGSPCQIPFPKNTKCPRLSWTFSCRASERRKKRTRSWLALHFLPVLPPYPGIQKFRKLVC